MPKPIVICTCKIFCGHPECEYCWPYCERELIAKCEEDQREHEHQQDLDIERDLGLWPSMDGWFEEAEIEMVPVEFCNV